MIEVKGLKKEFDGLKVLNGIDYTINQGEKIVVIGPSGSGKSTFLRCLNLLEEPTGGEIWFDGTNITDPQTEAPATEPQTGAAQQRIARKGVSAAEMRDVRKFKRKSDSGKEPQCRPSQSKIRYIRAF